MANIFDQFDPPEDTSGGNVFDQFDEQPSSGNVFDRFDTLPDVKLRRQGEDFLKRVPGVGAPEKQPLPKGYYDADNPPPDDQFIKEKKTVNGVEYRLHGPTGVIYDPDNKAVIDPVVLQAFGRKKPNQLAQKIYDANQAAPKPGEQGTLDRWMLNPLGRGKNQSLDPAYDVGMFLTGQSTPEQFAQGIVSNYEQAKAYPQDPRDVESMKQFQKANGFIESINVLADNPNIIGQTSVESLPAMAAMAAGSITGGLSGGAAGSVVPGVGTAAGALMGSISGTGLASGYVEFSNSLTQALAETGKPVTPENVLAAINDPAVMAAAKEKALKRGIAVGVFDAISAGIAGRIGKPVERLLGGGTVGRAVGAGTEVAGQGAAGAGGEAAGQYYGEGGIKRPADIVLEGAAELATGPIEIGSAVLGREAPGAVIPDRTQPTQTPPQSRQDPSLFPEAQTAGPGAPAAPGAPPPAGPQPAPTNPVVTGASAQDYLLADGYSPEQIADMTDDERRAALDSAMERGVEPREQASSQPPPVAPSAEETPPSASAAPARGAAEISPANSPKSPRKDFGEISAPRHAPGPAVWANADHDQPVTILDEPPKQDPASGQWFQLVEDGNGGSGYVPFDELRSKAVAKGVEPIDVWAGGPAPGTAPMAPRGTRSSRVNVQSEQDLEEVRPTVNAEPSPAQAAAGNYQKGHIKIHGFDVSIENPKGSVRRGTDEDGTDWASPELPADYGYFKRTEGRDGDKLDVYIGPDPASPRVFIVEQHDLKTGKFDELKVVMGARTLDEAVSLYIGSFDNPSLDRIGDVTEMPVEQFKEWLKQGNGKRPVAKSIKNARQRDARTQQDAGTYDLAADQTAVSQPTEQALSPLRGAGNNNAPRMGGGFSGVPEGRRPAPGEGNDAGPDQQRPGVSAGQYAMDRLENSVGQSPLSSDGRVQGRDDDGGRGIAPSGNEASNRSPSPAQRSADGVGTDTGPNSSLAGPGEGRNGPVSVAADDFDSIFREELDAEFGKPADGSAGFGSDISTASEPNSGDQRVSPVSEPVSAPAKKRKYGAPKPVNVLDFIASIGGIQDPTGELRGMDLPKMGPFGPIIRKNGLHPDKVREALVERGFLHDRGFGADQQASTTENDVYDLIAQHMGGQRVYAPEDQARAEELTTAKANRDLKPADWVDRHPIEERWGADVWNAIQEVFDLTDTTEESWSLQMVADAARLIAEGVTPGDAFERAAIMQEEADLDPETILPEVAQWMRARDEDAMVAYGDLPPFPDVEIPDVAPEQPQAEGESVSPSGEEGQDGGGEAADGGPGGTEDGAGEAGSEGGAGDTAGQDEAGLDDEVDPEEAARRARVAEWEDFQQNHQPRIETESLPDPRRKQAVPWAEIQTLEVEPGQFTASHSVNFADSGRSGLPSLEGERYASKAEAQAAMAQKIMDAASKKNGKQAQMIREWAEKYAAPEKAAPKAERGADAKEQLVIPGAEKDQKGALNNAARAPLKGSKPQQGMDVGLFGSERDQTDMFNKPAPKKAEAAPEPVAETPAVPAQPSGRIEDFGEKILGARKDAVRDIVKSLEDDVDVAAEPLSKSFPQPDYERLAEAGVDSKALALVAVMRDSIPTKPKKGWKVQHWAGQVRLLRDFAQKLLSGDVTADEIAIRMRSEFATLAKIANTAEVLADIEPRLLAYASQYRIAHANVSMLRGTRYNPAKSLYMLETEKNRWTDVDAPTIAEIKEPALAYIRAKAEKELGKDGEGKTRRTPISLYKDPHTKELFIGFKGVRGIIRLKAGFTSIKEARDYVTENADALQKQIDAMREGPDIRRAANMPRKGPFHREGDASPELFQETFGFRGVQFGNYVESDRRQTDLNESFDALMDLASALGIPPKALSLNGRLGLAFGARGHGGKNAAAAHYEPTQVVINLTKHAGPGSLAHEWLHALDHYFSRQNGAGDGRAFISEAKQRGDVREPVWKAWKDLERAISRGPFAKRSDELDKAKSKPYYGTTIEKAARAFEKYIVDKLNEKQTNNDYLANIELASGAYPLDAEMQNDGIRKAFDDLFAALEVKWSEDGKQALLSSRRQAPLSSRGPQSSFAAEVMTELASVDDLFQHPKVTSGTLERILSVLAKEIEPRGQFMLSETDRQNGVISKKRFVDPDGYDFFVLEDSDKQVWIDISGYKSGLGGSAIYAAVANYAHNAGKVFIGDPSGLSDDAMRRRTEAMLSSALKFGTTRHIEPHPRQLKGAPEIGIPPLKWTYGDDFGNVASLIEASTANTLSAAPEIADVRYDFGARAFRDAQGRAVSDGTFDQWRVAAQRARASGPGNSTLKRAVLLNTLLRSEGGARPGLLAQVLRQPGELVRRGGLEGLLYSTSENQGETSGVSPEGLARPEPPLPGFEVPHPPPGSGNLHRRQGGRNPYRFVISQRQTAELVHEIGQIAERILGHAIANVEIYTDQAQWNDTFGDAEDAVFDPNTGIISIALHGTQDLRSTLRHEAIHALRQAGVITAREWAVLSRMAQTRWIDQYKIRQRYEALYRERFEISEAELEQLLIEEAVADAMGEHWTKGPAEDVISRIFARIKAFLEAVRAALKGRGYTSAAQIAEANEILENIEQGRLARREQGTGQGREFPLSARQSEQAPLSSRPHQPVPNAAPADDGGRAPGAYVAADPSVTTAGEDRALEEFAGNVNLNNIDGPESLKEVLWDTAAQADGFMGARRGVVSHDQTRMLAEQMGMTVRQLLSRRRGQAFNAHEAFAARAMMVKSAELVRQAAIRVQRTRSDVDRAYFMRLMTRHAAIQEAVAGMTAEAGRALNQFRMQAGADYLRSVTEALNERSINGRIGNNGIDDLAGMVTEMPEPGQVETLARDLYRPGFLDMIREFYVNALLSGPTTQTVNFLSNLLTAVNQIPEQFLAEQIGRFHGGDKVEQGEAVAKAVGLLEGSREGLRLAWTTLKTGEQHTPETQFDQRTGKAIPGAIGEVVRLPSRLMMSADDFFKAINYRAELNALAVRQASSEGLSGQQFAERIQDLRDNPSDQMIRRAKDAAAYNTFQNKLGPKGQILMRMREAWCLWPILPFLRTPINILRYATERTPLAPFLMRDARERLMGKKGRVAQDLQISRMVLGTIVMTGMASMVLQGMVTGGGSDDDKEKAVDRANGWQPYSFHIGNKFYSYLRFDPFALHLGVVADMIEMRDKFKEGDYVKVASSLAASIVNNIAEKTWLKSATKFAEMVNNPQRFMSRFLTDLAVGFVPNFSAQIARVNDLAFRDAHDFIQRIKERIPGQKETLPQRFDLFGEPVTGEGNLGPDILSPVYISTEKNNPVAKALKEAGYFPGLPRRHINGHDLTGEQFAEYTEMAGKEAVRRLTRIVTSDSWGRRSQDNRERVLKQGFDKARELARKKLMAKYPELRGKANP